MLNIDEQRIERAKQLRTLRKNSGLTQWGLYSISGVCTKTISKMERGLVSWSIDTELIIRTCIDNFLKTD